MISRLTVDESAAPSCVSLSPGAQKGEHLRQRCGDLSACRTIFVPAALDRAPVRSCVACVGACSEIDTGTRSETAFRHNCRVSSGSTGLVRKLSKTLRTASRGAGRDCRGWLWK